MLKVANNFYYSPTSVGPSGSSSTSVSSIKSMNPRTWDDVVGAVSGVCANACKPTEAIAPVLISHAAKSAMVALLLILLYARIVVIA